MSEYNPFTDCEPIILDGGFGVQSKSWTINCSTRRDADLTADVIEAAYKAGVRDNQSAVRLVLLGPDVTD